MIENLWSTPVATYDLRSDFIDFEQTNEEMIRKFPDRTRESNCFKFDNQPAFEEFNWILRQKLDEYAFEVGIDQLVYFNGFFNAHTFGQVNAPHAHPACMVVAVYYPRHLGEQHGDILLQDPRGGVLWKDVQDEDSRGIGGYRIFKRIAPKTGQLIVFPAFVVHSVEPNLLSTAPPRLSIGINCYSRRFIQHFKNDV